MRTFAGVAMLVPLLSMALAAQADRLGQARTHYNQGQFDEAIAAAMEARSAAATADAAALVLGRAHLGRFRQSNDQADLAAAREAFRSLNPAALTPRDRVELIIGLGEALFADGAFGAAAQTFETALDRSSEVGAAARERLLDWWATAVDRWAQARPAAERAPLYREVVERMEAELRRDAASSAASYWLTAATRGLGDLDAAWNAAIAGWIRAPLAPDRGAALRADLDRLMLQAIIPERARKLQGGRPVDPQAIAALTAEWEQIKGKWTKP